MKTGRGVLIAAAAVLGLSPYFIGVKIESAAQEYIERYQVPGYQYSLDVDRGYRSSVFTYSFAIDPELLSSSYGFSAEEIAATTEIFDQFKLKVRVQHGPVLTQNGFGIGLADAASSINDRDYPELADYMRLVGISEFFIATGRVGFNGAGEVQYRVPAMTYTNEWLVIDASFTGFDGTLSFQDFGRDIVSTGMSQGGKFIMEGLAFIDIGPMFLSSEITMNEGSRWLGTGDVDFQMESLILGSPEQSGSIENLVVKMQLTDGDSVKSMNIQYLLGLDNLDSTALQLETAEVAFAYKNISKSVLENYIEMAATLNVQDEAELKSAMFQFALDELPRALLHNPGLAVPRLAFTHEGKTFEASLSTAIDGQKVALPVDFLRPDLLLPALTAELHLDADESLIQDLIMWQVASKVDASFAGNTDFDLTAEMRKTMIEQQASMSLNIAAGQGFILREDGRIKADIRLADRMLDINGTQMPLPF